MRGVPVLRPGLSYNKKKSSTDVCCTSIRKVDYVNIGVASDQTLALIPGLEKKIDEHVLFLLKILSSKKNNERKKQQSL